MTNTNRRQLVERKIVELLVSGEGRNAVCRTLRVGKNRLAHVREKAREYGYLNGSVPIPPYPEPLFPDPVDSRSLQRSESDLQLEKHQEWVEERLRAGWQPITIFEELPIDVGRSSFYRFLHRHKLAALGESVRKSIAEEIIYAPGEALLVDWGKLRNVIHKDTGKKQTLWMFIGIMGHSRYMSVRLVWSHDVPTTLTTLEDILKELGGVPKRIISDNPKCFSISASKYEPLLNPAYERFASHYGAQIECLPPRTPELKGKVERVMPFARRLYQAHGDEWFGLAESQDYINKKVAVANERIHGTTRRKPISGFIEEETKILNPLPGIAYEIEEFHEGKVRGDTHVRFRNKYYSVEETYRNQKVIVIGNSKQVSIYHKGKLIEVHDRITDPYQSKSTKDCHKGPWAKALKDGSYYRKAASKLGPDVEAVILKLLMQGNGFIDTRKIWGILALDKKYSSKAINEACKHAVSLSSYSYRTIVGLLESGVGKKSEKQNNDIKPQPSYVSKFLRPIEEYKQLLN